ncbi:RNA polymerase sigma-70 factor (ECF subfamily) [Litoreibacter ponti]|uniref:RNA polymerase sigma-70 factor (ECF subfamily) n=1 Tax=Litoreibacter ponti TaxID=1510457 RepID=A0A2T6BE62_9RHOB|nr:DUF6596 domain-containing protein [Litoreibacter ponti]PTX54349.1 RNA polymerase sigma-70 factor (ECF subfamily) [Litoreibacter ponti]
MSDAAARAEQIARASYGKLVAILAARDRDIARAEDALATAFAKALASWPRDGVPDRPEAWLITTARHAATDSWRRDARHDPLDEVPEMQTETPHPIPDDRLRLMFVCAHPALDRGVHTAMMLQTVLGVTSERMARAFQLRPSTLSQRLVRAKTKIKQAGIAFELPEADALPARLGAVLEAVYGAYAIDWMVPDSAGDLTREALFLSDLTAQLCPDEPEALGLAALIAFLAARHEARLAGGMLVPLHAQDTDLWDHDMITHAAHVLTRASRLGQPGRFQLEASIQAVHAARAQTGRTDWRALSQLYAGLLHVAPSLGAEVARAAVVAEDAGADQGLALLDLIAPECIARFQPYWATRAHILRQLDHPDAPEAYAKAISLCTEPPLRRWLEAERDALIH